MEQSNRRQNPAELRLLLATITISAVALLLLARLRFPAPPPVPQIPVTPPLERLAASATYDELARIVGSVQARLAPSLIPLRLAHRLPQDVPLDSSALAADGPAAGMSLAIRLGETTALAYVPPGASVPDRLPGGEAIRLVGLDEIRSLALLEVPKGPAVVPRSSSVPMVDVPAYLAIGEPSALGASVRPVFVARTDPRADSRWRTTMYAMGMEPVAPGRPLFSLGGEFIGLLVPANGGIALLPASDVIAAAGRLQSAGTGRHSRFGFSVQPLTAPLAAATGATGGVVVALVVPNGPAATALRVGDVIDAVNGQPVATVDALLMRVAALQPGSPLTLRILREGTRSDVAISPPPERAAEQKSAEADLGLTMRTVPGTGTEIVVVSPGGAGSRAGIRSGDIVTHLNGQERPTAAAVERAWANARAPLVLGVRRGIQPLVIAVSR